MACNCGKKKPRRTYKVTYPDGSTKVFVSETDAKKAVKRRGGAYTPAS